ncbi:L,D-transpeptidase family protein [Rubrolithibacter danxiaensis]|uniref:L,D-transpeptidase family protein n=1 Tax=Rubrolithibacter danxiaensis TaxID=3390805 RepID=UPI003BF8C675
MTKENIKYLFIFLLFSTTIFQSCKKSRSDIGAILFKESKNRVFKKVDSAAYYKVFKQVLSESEEDVRNPNLINSFYKKHEYEPFFVVNYIKDGQLKEILNYFQKATDHGLDPEFFHYTELKTLADKIYDKHGIKSADEAYKSIARLEVLTATSLIDYSNALQYGIVNPRRIFARYYIKTARPDSLAMLKVFREKDLKTFLDSIQPKDPSYKKLQQALVSGFQYPGLSKEETAKTIKLNLERLRWKTGRDQDNRYVWVNIPDFRLTFFDSGKPKLSMKVCVGESKEINYYEKLRQYNDSGDINDRPHNHETPILSSAIHTIVVNPVWNIPKSIVQTEIAQKAMEDPYYLSNNGIQVFYKGEQMDADNIDWDAVTRDNLQLEFKQSPGDENALGKMKFLFKNSSSVYLHDTPVKSAFNLNNRAISHGCVRVENPLALAEAIAPTGSMFNTIQTEFKGNSEDSRSFSIKNKVPVYLDYMTCWVDSEGKIQIRPDVYHLDQILSRTLGKALS